VDNNSTDGSRDVLRHEPVELIESRQNLGFGRAANIGLRLSTAEFVLLLNPDTVVPAGTLTSCIDALRARPNAGMLGCKLVRLDGSLDHACKRQIPTPASSLSYFLRRIGRRRTTPAGRYTATELGADDEGTVGAINGAFMLVRRAAIEEVGTFDEDYWMYGEDLDWCLRFTQRGWQVVYWPGATAIHVKAGITGTRRSLRVNFAFHQSMWIFFRKHQAGQYPAAMSALIWLGVWTKFTYSAVSNAWNATVSASPVS
jgi:GT2 family glycosyltransferase